MKVKSTMEQVYPIYTTTKPNEYLGTIEITGSKSEVEMYLKYCMNYTNEDRYKIILTATIDKKIDI